MKNGKAKQLQPIFIVTTCEPYASRRPKTECPEPYVWQYSAVNRSVSDFSPIHSLTGLWPKLIRFTFRRVFDARDVWFLVRV